MRAATFCAMLLTAIAAAAGTQEFYAHPDGMPDEGTDKALLDACWKALRMRDDLPVDGTEAVMIPRYLPLTAGRMARYGLSGARPGMRYADTSFIIWTRDPAGVAFPLAIRCEVPFDPAAPEFTRIFLSEDESLNPNLPVDARPVRP